MTKDELREETRKRLTEEDPILGQDPDEVGRQMPNVLDQLIAEADLSRLQHTRSAEQGLTEPYREAHKRVAEKNGRTGDTLRTLKDALYPDS